MRAPVKNRCAKICLTVGLIAGVIHAAAAEESVPRKVTLDDAYAVKGVGAIAANPTQPVLAVEEGPGILIVAAKDGRQLKRLDGTAPQWSPDGKKLAFFSRSSGHAQVHVWTMSADTEVQATKLPNGVVANHRTMGATCGPQRTSWSPDGRSIAFATIAISLEGIPSADTTVPAVRVFKSHPTDRRSSLEAIFKNRDAASGILRSPGDWEVWFSAEPDFVAAMNIGEQFPEQVANRIMVVDIASGALKFLPGTATQYFCPAWSPDGRTIASIADVTEPTLSNESYGALGSPANSTVALHDLHTGRERLLPADPLSRVRSLVWSGNGRLATIAESGKKQSGFTRLVTIETGSGRTSTIATPDGHAVLELREGRRGKVGVRLAGRFVDTVWSFDARSEKFDAAQTFDWQMTSFDFLPDRTLAFWAESATFSGRLVLSAPNAAARVIHDANPQIAQLALGEQRRLTWKNKSGDEVDGIVILPPGYRSGERYPVVVDAYPMPAKDRFRLRPIVEDMGQLMAAEGFVIFRPALRAPHGAYWYTRDEAYQVKAVGAPGVKVMVDDFESGIEALVAQGIADPARIGIYGFSNGGWVANLLVTETKMLAAAAVQSGISNAIGMSLGLTVLMPRGVDAATGGNVFDNLDDYVRLSPIFRMRDVTTPMLLMVGDYDRLWVPQMIAQYGVLRAEGRDVTLVRYTAEGHTRAKRETAIDAHQRVTEFFRQHLGVAGSVSE
ncbi:S9 family peptidase [Steroidobacter cummioxidans]|uniref:S9 family peptidase n=1 Tax=Steroidobacter cummioxidans TaxID=1803913 RepID=UPI000E31330B|nr:prolyl oligopeptidase family serine peptidase [Steroidobacter cummioxidans]